MTTVTRRRFLLSTATIAAAVGTPFSALGARPAQARDRAGRLCVSPDYGPPAPVRDETTGLPLLSLPEGFQYISHGWTGDVMKDGVPTPDAHDGMAAFRHHGRVHLVRNHEGGQGAGAFATGEFTYDASSGGGTTTLIFDPERGQWRDDYTSLSGTVRNCAGGPTPWGTWLSCEETFLTDGKRHGYVFEVPADGLASGDPLPALGRFSHEAAAVDPETGIVYLTEDRGNSCLYRFVPKRPGRLAEGGTLQAMALGAATVNTGAAGAGASWPVSWVTIANPDPDTDTVRVEALGKGAASIVRGEGCWYGNGVVYVVATGGGAALEGQVFALDPDEKTFTCLYASPGAAVLDNPDNIAVSPRGGLVLCEDGSNPVQSLHGLTADGEIFRFADNNVVLNGERNGLIGDFRGSEWAGATFEPRKGQWLFVNVQSPGITFAITGPWKEGAL